MDYQVKVLNQQTGTYLVCWDGDKTPRGAVVGGFEINYTREGTAFGRATGTSEQERVVGRYDRIIDCGKVITSDPQILEMVKDGPRESQAMVISVKARP